MDIRAPGRVFAIVGNLDAPGEVGRKRFPHVNWVEDE